MIQPNEQSTMKQVGTIVKVAGPLIVATGLADVQMFDVVRVSEKRLIGEVIELRGDRASIQVYEETAGLGPGEPVYVTGEPLSVDLAPGLIESIFDGIQRPLTTIYNESGDRISRGIDVPKLDREKKWPFVPACQKGDVLKPGDVIGTVQETPAVLQKIMMPPKLEGTVDWVFDGEANIVEPIARIKKKDGEIVEAGQCDAAVPIQKKSPPMNLWSPASASLTRCSRSLRAVSPLFQGHLVPVKPLYSISWQNGPMPTSLSTLAVANVVMK